MKMLLISKFSPIWFHIMRFTQCISPLAFSNRYRSGFVAAVLCCAVVAKSLILSSLVVATVRRAQINLQHKRTATINLCKLMQNGSAQVALVQEPYFRKGNLYLGNFVNPEFATFSKHEMANSRVMPRAFVLVNNAIVATHISELTTRDVCAITIDVSVENLNRKYVYCSVYLPHDEPSPTDAFKQVIAYCTSKGLPLIVGSDANAHHIIWGSSDINLRGSSLMEYLSSTDLALLNIGNRPSFVVSAREKVSDITLCSSRISHEVTNWHVSDKESLYDHRYIFIEHLNVTSHTLRFRNPPVNKLRSFY
ncbi:uncharacterized protein LOC134289731 [Aedes albopictus]|uniref:Endonuclease/exonuclease/phosphatase domain-containing protein n=1 Tax=Aedes albopictus TaxID=7160 RepID=A0ABM1YW08_AEDAL